MVLGTEVGLRPHDLVAEPPPQFLANFYCGRTAGCTKMPLGKEVGHRPQCVRSEPSSPKKGGRGHSPQYLAHVCCGQTAGWINMALGMEVSLDPGHTMPDGDPAPLARKGAEPPIFGQFLLWPNGWIHQDATWYGDRPQPRQILDPSTPQTLSVGLYNQLT